MSAIGLMLIGAGLLTAWSGFDRVIVFDVLRSFIGAPVAHRTTEGALGDSGGGVASGGRFPGNEDPHAPTTETGQ